MQFGTIVFGVLLFHTTDDTVDNVTFGILITRSKEGVRVRWDAGWVRLGAGESPSRLYLSR